MPPSGNLDKQPDAFVRAALTLLHHEANGTGVTPNWWRLGGIGVAGVCSPR